MTGRYVRHRRWWFHRTAGVWRIVLIVGTPLSRPLHPGPWRPATRRTDWL